MRGGGSACLSWIPDPWTKNVIYVPSLLPVWEAARAYNLRSCRLMQVAGRRMRRLRSARRMELGGFEALDLGC
jgi:hypothetical protein